MDSEMLLNYDSLCSRKQIHEPSLPQFKSIFCIFKSSSTFVIRHADELLPILETKERTALVGNRNR